MDVAQTSVNPGYAVLVTDRWRVELAVPLDLNKFDKSRPILIPSHSGGVL